MMSITDAAAHQIQTLLDKRSQSSFGIRVGIKSGGCSGMSYYIEYADEKQKYDELIEDKGVRVLIDPKALMYLMGAVMDYSSDKFKSGFTFNNPNEKGSCGCGKSFTA